MSIQRYPILKVVKLVVDHDQTRIRPVGRAEAIVATPSGVETTMLRIDPLTNLGGPIVFCYRITPADGKDLPGFPLVAEFAVPPNSPEDFMNPDNFHLSAE